VAEIRAMRDDEIEQVLSVLRAAFPTDSEARLVSALRADPAYEPELSIVATEQGRIVGHVLLTRATFRSDEGSAGATANVVCLAPLAVVPEAQRRGIGSCLVDAGLAAARRLGFGVVLVLGDPGYYPRFGFVPAAPLGVRAPMDVPDEAWMLCELEEGAARGLNGVTSLAAPFDDPEYW
jgi:putative acetyltransferase